MNKTQIDFLHKLKKKKYRDKHQQFIVENPKVIWEEYNNPWLEMVYVTEKFFKEHEDEMVFKKTEVISEKEIAKIASQVNPAGMMALFNVPKQKKFTFQKQNILILDHVTDPGNMGTIIRTADWFGFHALFLSKNCVDVYNTKVVASTMGSIFRLNIYNDLDLPEIIPGLKDAGYTIAVTDLRGGEVKFNKKEKVALVIGSESRGISEEIRELADKSLKITKFGKAESLNAAVAAGIIMHQIKS
ncbi:RNA methyltransferase [bacterium]|jgi:RNA methyltransferase, TrmH family|nr:RNA methyltransferase [bacterium]MBT4649024.1 RNA methyltransferase [bacterium]